jgi:hypothetical protein
VRLGLMSILPKCPRGYALAGTDALLLALHWSKVPATDLTLIEAAAAVGVKCIIFPTKFGRDSANEVMLNAAPVHGPKTGPRVRIEELGSKWVGVVANPWLDYMSSST